MKGWYLKNVPWWVETVLAAFGLFTVWLTTNGKWGVSQKFYAIVMTAIILEGFIRRLWANSKGKASP